MGKREIRTSKIMTKAIFFFFAVHCVMLWKIHIENFLWYPHEYIYRSVLISQQRENSFVWSSGENWYFLPAQCYSFCYRFLLLLVCLKMKFLCILFLISLLQIDEVAVFFSLPNFNERKERSKWNGKSLLLSKL